MNARDRERVEKLSTPHLADACMRVGVEVRCGPSSLRPIERAMRCAGRARPARHVGSVDVFLEALEVAEPGEVLVVDDGGRSDQACIGDLVTLETANAGLSGVIVWGLHRDTLELLQIGLPLFSLGTLPTGPARVEPRSPDVLAWARVGDWTVSPDDIVAADADGVIFLPSDRLSTIIDAAEAISGTERDHAGKMRSGTSFRQQAALEDYMTKRAVDPGFSFRDHLRRIGGAIEE